MYEGRYKCLNCQGFTNSPDTFAMFTVSTKTNKNRIVRDFIVPMVRFSRSN